MQVRWKIHPVEENRATLGYYRARRINCSEFRYNFGGVVLLVFFAMTLYQWYVFDSWSYVSARRFCFWPGFYTSSWGDGQCRSFFGFLLIAILKFEIIFVIFKTVRGHYNHYHLYHQTVPPLRLFVCLFSWRYNPFWLYFHSPVAGFSFLVFDVSSSHTTTRHSR
jgi:hypothetical protein